MHLPCSFVGRAVCVSATAVLVAAGMSPVFAQQGNNKGIVRDWTNHHVIFSNPGSEMDALMKGRRQEWQRLVNDPRYRSQQIRRSPEWAARFGTFEPELSQSGAEHGRHLGFSHRANSDAGDWQEPIGSAGHGTAQGMFPAEYGADFSVASCSDYIVFPVNASGKNTGTGSKQANLVGFTNLYKSTCGNSVPTVKFAYYVGTGTVQTSPVLSEDGTKVAFVESRTGASIFHVLTLGTTGSNGTAYNAPAAVGGATNNAKVVNLTLNGGVSVTRSSPFVDYSGDAAYVGDDHGMLHKFTGIFMGTPAEVTSGGWPFSVASGAILTGPVLDGGASGNLFVAGSNGNLYCISNPGGTPAFCGTPAVSVGGGGAVLDGPIVDSTAETVFSEATSGNSAGSTAFLMQATTSLSNVVRVNMGLGEGTGGAGPNLHNGDFDNTYYSSSPGSYAGNMYFCGNTTTSFTFRGNTITYATPELYQVGFDSNGTINGSATPVYQLVASGNTGTGVSCTPLTEIYNGTTDYLFLGVSGFGAPTGCEANFGFFTLNEACIMSFKLPTSGSFPGAPAATYQLGGFDDGNGSSGIVVDNVSTTTGASQIYFSNLENGDATQLSQAGLN